MKLTGEQLFTKLVDEYQIIGEKGVINFSLKNLTISVETKDTVGNLLQEWLKAWMKLEKIDFEENTNSQSFPDFHLDTENK
jgi:type II restriction enzyme